MATNDDKNLRQVYETLRREGYTPPEYEKFRQDMTADKNLRGSTRHYAAKDTPPRITTHSAPTCSAILNRPLPRRLPPQS